MVMAWMRWTYSESIPHAPNNGASSCRYHNRRPHGSWRSRDPHRHHDDIHGYHQVPYHRDLS